MVHADGDAILHVKEDVKAHAILVAQVDVGGAVGAHQSKVLKYGTQFISIKT